MYRAIVEGKATGNENEQHTVHFICANPLSLKVYFQNDCFLITFSFGVGALV